MCKTMQVIVDREREEAEITEGKAHCAEPLEKR